jgi:beta-phosphoglucomutase-like phosphatase (HAD superfamily)
MDLLFDLDGTLTNSAPGILRCFAHALDHVGRRTIDVPVHLAVGPPLYRVFEALLPIEDVRLIEPAIVAYRERYEAIGIFENSAYPGVHDALSTLRRKGHHMRSERHERIDPNRSACLDPGRCQRDAHQQNSTDSERRWIAVWRPGRTKVRPQSVGSDQAAGDEGTLEG